MQQMASHSQLASTASADQFRYIPPIITRGRVWTPLDGYIFTLAVGIILHHKIYSTMGPARPYTILR